MTAGAWLFAAFVSLSLFNAGAMTTLQLQHYGIYTHVGRESFADYIRANNRAAVVPVILPALTLLVVTGLLLVVRPAFMTTTDAYAAFALNIVQLASTAIWQRRLQAEMAVSGYDGAKIETLVTTNWIRTVAFLAQALIAVRLVVHILG